MSPVSAGAVQPRVLVLMATRNGEPWIGAQLASIFAQSGVQVVVLASDDCSTDSTPSFLRSLAASRADLKLEVRSAPSGSAGANFKHLLATAELEGFDYIALSDQDDIWHRDHLLRGCAALTARPSAGGYSCAVRTFGAGRNAVLAQDAGLRRFDYLFEGAGQGCTFVITRAIAARVQTVCREHAALASALHYHDWLIYLVVRCAGCDWIFDEIASLDYRQHENNEIGARVGVGAVARRLKLIRDGWLRKQVVAALALASELAPGDEAVRRLRSVFCDRDSATRRLRLALIVATQSRRRSVDRLVLCCSAFAGWI